ncbi:MAG TPA: amidohydrolase [Euzebyales bacterium]|nr:amidohydrolase [Euzebyales bacterium]
MLLLTGATVWTGTGELLRPGTVAVASGRIASVEQGGGTRPAGTDEVIDLTGCTLLPGFQDGHVHPGDGGLRRRRCDLSVTTDGEHGYVAAVAAYAHAHPDAPWIVGDGWLMPDFPGGLPRRQALDTVVADRPVFLVNADGHGAWVNSRALEVAGVTAQTADPQDGRIERDPDGTPTGALHEGAMELVSRHMPAPEPGELRAALLDAQRHLHALGITAWTDASITPADQAAYQALADAGELTARVTAALWWDRQRGLEQIADLVTRRAATRGDRLTASTVKIMQDGVVENATAAMLDPYLDASGVPTGDVGLSYVAPTLLAEAVTRLDRLGFQVHVHAIGDRAIREALDAFAAARRAGGTGDRRHTIAHVQVVDPDDLPRFADLDVVVTAQPLWAQPEPQMTDLTLPVLGHRRGGWQYPWASLLRSGAPLAFGSDWPVSSADPLQGIAVAIDRIGPDTPGGAQPFLPAERLTLDEALRAATSGSAHLHHLDDRTGTIAVGKEADLTVVGAPLFGDGACPPAEARVVLTLVAGETVYREASL